MGSQTKDDEMDRPRTEEIRNAYKIFIGKT
jgi:hypothetical protein